MNSPCPVSDPVLVIDRLSFAYDGTLVLDDVTLTIGQGDFVCIVGPNGGGKTTLLKLILGLLRPASGSIRVFGGTPQEARARMGYVPQHVLLDPQFPVSVQDVVLMGRLGSGSAWGRYSRTDHDAAAVALESVGLAALRRQSFFALSGGQRQRALIARALAGNPDLLLLDEPTANLDAHVEGEFYDLLRQLNQRMTILLVSHDLGFVAQMVKTVVCVSRSVAVHPTSALSGTLIREMYGGEVRMVRHDHPQHTGQNA